MQVYRNVLMALAGVVLAACSTVQAQAERGLVAHYVFDQDTAGNVTDLSGSGNDATAVKTTYLPELDGRRGVLRFDGGESVLNCPDSDSLFFDGDMSFEMWARLNAPVKETWATVFGDEQNFALYIAYWYTVVLWHNTLDPTFGSESMVLPVERRILGDTWQHIAVVVEYPRCRFYHNGQLLRDSYMPINGIINRTRTAKVIGKNAPMDLDEFRLYRRALSAAEVAAHAKGEEAPPGRNDELVTEADWYAKTLTVRLTSKGVNCSGQTAEMTLLRGDSTGAATPQIAAFREAAEGSGRFVAQAEFPLAGLEGQSLDAVARLADANGKVTRSVYRHVSLKKPGWVHAQDGYSDEVLAPWTPVEAESGPEGTVDVRVWGRRYALGGAPLPRQIETTGTELLAAPMSLSARADGEDVTWRGGAARIRESRPTLASLTQRLESDAVTLQVSTAVEYDGYAVFDCEVRARRDLSLDTLTVDMPLWTRYATLCYGDRVLPRNDEIPIREWYSGAVRGDLDFRFSPCIWLGDEERGLCWQAESDEDWHNADRQRAIEILPRGETTTFRAHLVDAPKRLAAGEALHYKFALLATPIKPMVSDAWDLRIVRSEPYGADLSLPDRTVNGKPEIEFLAETGMRRLLTLGCDVWPHPMPLHEQYSRLLHRLNDELHANGLKHHSYQIHERFPTMAPEFDGYGLQMAQRPMNQYIPGSNPPGDPRPGPVGVEYGADSQGTIMICPKSEALQDAYVHALALRLDEYGDDGVYLDGTAQTPPCRNTAHGCGYRAEDGSLRDTYPVFGVRELMKRIYTVVKQRRPEGVVDVHGSWGYNPPGLAYADVFWTGEQWWHLRSTGASYIAGELPLDMFRTEFMGTQIGVPIETLAYRLGPQPKVAAISLLHDCPVRPSSTGLDQRKGRSLDEQSFFDVMVKLWRVRDEFGAKDAEKLFYWRNSDYVTVSPEKCYATLLKHPRNGVLAFISNLAPDAQTVTVQFDLARLGLRERKLDAFDALSGEPIRLDVDGTLSLPLGSEEWVYVWLRPVARAGE